MDRVICISCSRDSVISGTLAKVTPDESRVELEKNLQTELSVLSTDDNTSN